MHFKMENLAPYTRDSQSFYHHYMLSRIHAPTAEALHIAEDAKLLQECTFTHNHCSSVVAHCRGWSVVMGKVAFKKDNLP